MEEMVNAKDRIFVNEECYPVGEMFGVNIYEVQHVRTRKYIYVTIGELSR